MSDDLDELAAGLAEFAPAQRHRERTPREERILVGFEEIRQFFRKHGRLPEHGDDRDIFERVYAVRMQRMGASEECRTTVGVLDTEHWLSMADADTPDEIDDDALFAELAQGEDEADLAVLTHVRTSAEKRAAEEIAHRQSCRDFERYAPIFQAVKAEIKSGIRQTRLIKTKTVEEIQVGTLFVIGGQIAYVAEIGEPFPTPFNEQRMDCRLRVIYDNSTESDLLQRSLQRALHRDENARVVTDPDAGPLFRDALEEGDVINGTIYVLRSRSDNPFVTEHRELIHKIGVTGNSVPTRIANASQDPTYLMAEVEVVASYQLAGINPKRMEALFHKLFSGAQIEVLIHDRFGVPVKPREWFLVPLHVIDEAVRRIIDGSIEGVRYDPGTASLRKDI